jgi:hypothetical protein
MAKLGVSRETLAGMLRQHGEDDLAERAPSLSDDELARIGTLGAYYAFSENAMALGGSMGGTRALSLATIDVLEDTGRDLLAEGDYCPGDLLASVLRVDGAFWKRSPDLDVSVRQLTRDLTRDLHERSKPEPGLRELIDTFIRDHSARRRTFRNDPELAIALIEKQ